MTPKIVTLPGSTQFTDPAGKLTMQGARILEDIQRAFSTASGSSSATPGDETPTTYLVGPTAVSGQHVLMTINAFGAVGQADPSVATNAARIVGISTGGAYANAEVSVVRFGELEDPGFAFDLTKRIFCGASGQLTQAPPTSGFALCVGAPITSTKMRVEIDAPIFLT